jgi:hypothetical protein
MATTQQQQVLVELPEGVEGRMLDLCKTDDALEWLRHTTPDVVSNIVKALKAAKKEGHGDMGINWVLILGALPKSLADDHSDKFSERAVKDVVGLFESVLLDLAASASWKRTGDFLDDYHNELVGIIVPWARVPLFVKHMMKKGFAALAKLMKAANVFPCPNLCEKVLMVINNANTRVSRMTIDEAAPLKMVDMIESVIYQLEATGLVAQALRALTSPVRDSQTYGMEGYLDFLNCVIRDDDLIMKRCRPGTNVGKILKALLDGTDGYKPGNNSGANPDLELVQTRLKIFYDKTLLDNEELASLRMVCRMCSKQAETLKRCGRCKCAAYCSRYVFSCFFYADDSTFSGSRLPAGETTDSIFFLYFTTCRECQLEDWKQHRKMCKKENSGETMPVARVTADWVRENISAIRTEVQRVAGRRGLSTKDVVLEIDLKKTSNPGIVVKPYRDYVDGERTGMPDWDDCKINRDFVAGLKDCHRRMTEEHILMVHRSYDTDYGVMRFLGGFESK